MQKELPLLRKKEDPNSERSKRNLRGREPDTFPEETYAVILRFMVKPEPGY